MCFTDRFFFYPVLASDVLVLYWILNSDGCLLSLSLTVSMHHFHNWRLFVAHGQVCHILLVLLNVTVACTLKVLPLG
ncbi:uncharacterized protein F5147DRAFT_383627 [Suillus discolor]|uniref:Uncharacterized protein n=1 Tax=Suillus discolor TaxID=1912936 RepID=A0A9P7JYC4_9AGAM|nr:uncharacterized protein F5147DRAFT_383627 [Suillus discolor]KAG2115887.1 hypothetical protein F5147DRAFT_383627 [Suillus discolor]